jgi:hypothetical protein
MVHLVLVPLALRDLDRDVELHTRSFVAAGLSGTARS